jgi:glucokinase
MILAGDIGGTSTRLALYEQKGDQLQSVAEKTFPSGNYTGLEQVVDEFLNGQAKTVSRACFGIAGPVQNGRVVTPNLPWVVDAALLSKELGLAAVSLLNDLEANAHGIAALKPADFATLNPGAPNARGNGAVISVGTGLGEAGLFWDGQTHRPFACEGGHSDFAPRTPLEAQLLLYLREKHDHVSYERILSGRGLFTVYEFLRFSGHGEPNPEVAREMTQGDPAAVVSRAGLQGRCKVCVQALDLFASLYGAEAGNLALKIMATGGVFIGGGVAPKIIAKLKEPAFMESFAAKGRLTPLLQAIPVRVIMRDTTALLGAARFAALRAHP